MVHRPPQRIMPLLSYLIFLLLLLDKEAIAFTSRVISPPQNHENRQKPTRTKTQLKLTSYNDVLQENFSKRFPIIDRLDSLYTQSSIKIKCPFFRRRAADLIDNAVMVCRFLLIRHKSLLGVDAAGEFDSLIQDLVPPGCRAIGKHIVNRGQDGDVWKLRHLEPNRIADIIRQDWLGIASTNVPASRHHTGYYINGKLNSTVYCDDCLFDGPDPDMPVRGLRKYLSAASKLFDHKKSYADLMDLDIVTENDTTVIVAKWRIGGVLMLPWKPIVKPYTGRTLYHLNEEGLIYSHEEFWDISVLEAFVSTLWPEVGTKIWSTHTFSGNDNGLERVDG